eukprot:snap_masked-scaffold_33-processed-gene-3.25-mRNA-1 protein AED:1.00 eAED:1.00 QI:0/0/0/0/1/1/2/0/83
MLQMLIDSSGVNEAESKSIYGNIILVNEEVLSYICKCGSIATLNSTQAEHATISICLEDLKVIYILLECLKASFDVVFEAKVV